MTGTAAGRTPSPFEDWRASDFVDGPNGSGYYTYGIDAPGITPGGNVIPHGHAIEFHSKVPAVAEARRNLALAAPDLVKALEEIKARHTTNGFMDKTAKIAAEALAAAKTGGA